MTHKPLPELYAYIFRHIASATNGTNVVTDEVIFQAMRKVIYKAPKPIFRYMIKEYEHEYGVLKCLSEKNDRYLVVLNPDTRRRLNKLKEHVFPVDI